MLKHLLSAASNFQVLSGNIQLVYQSSGQPLSMTIVVRLLDNNGNLANNVAPLFVLASLSAAEVNSGLGLLLTGALSVPFIHGVATFPNNTAAALALTGPSTNTSTPYTPQVRVAVCCHLICTAAVTILDGSTRTIQNQLSIKLRKCTYGEEYLLQSHCSPCQSGK